MELEDLAKRVNNTKRLMQLESTPVAPFDPSESMESLEEAKDYIRFLYAMVQEKEKAKEEMAADLKELREEISKLSRQHEKDQEARTKLMDQFVKMTESQTDVTEQLAAMNKENIRLTNLVTKLTEQLAIAKKEKYAGKTQKTKKPKDNSLKSEKNRSEERDDCDGGNMQKPTDEPESSENVQTEVHATGVDQNRKGSKYNTMSADEVMTHISDETRIPEGCIYLFKRICRSFEQIIKVIEHDYEMVVYMDKDGKMHEAYLPVEGEPSYIDKFPGTHASAGFLANVAFSKYVMCTPFYREMNRIVASKMSTCRQTLINWIHKGAKYLDKLTEEFKNLLFSENGIVNADETWERLVLKEGKKGYIWCFVNRITKVVMFHYDKGSRSRHSLKEFIGDRKIQALQSDGYNVYMYLDDEVINADHLCCMAHARAKFVYALQQGKDEKAEHFINLMGKLYKLEEEVKNLSPQEILTIRNSERAKKIKAELLNELDRLLGQRVGTSDTLMGKALRYFHKFRQQLFKYMDDGRYTIDNLISERSIRPFTVERNNAPTFCSHKGVEVSALYHTVIETCKLQGYSALEYMEAFFTAIIHGRTDYKNLMPATIGIKPIN